MSSTETVLHRWTLEEAARVLNEWWSAAPLDVAARSLLTPDALAESARKAGCEIVSEPIRNWEERIDREIYEELVSRAGPIRGRLLLITEASFLDDVGAFEVAADGIVAAMDEHQRRFEPVFNGDVILALLDERRIACIHHSSYLIRVSSPPE